MKTRWRMACLVSVAIAIMLFWSLACAGHGLASNFVLLAACRLLLGAGEGGSFPAATRVVAEWFPVSERSTAMGIMNAGTAGGMVVAPPLITLVLSFASWRWIFFITGAAGLLWTLLRTAIVVHAGHDSARGHIETVDPTKYDAGFCQNRRVGMIFGSNPTPLRTERVGHWNG